MAGRGYTVFDTGVGRCGIAWSDSGVIGVQLPEAREMRPPLNIEIAIENIIAVRRT